MGHKTKKYVQLGEAAAQGCFYDAFLELKVLPGKIVELPANYRKSKKILAALRGGHLATPDSEDVKKYLASQEDDSSGGDSSDDDNNEVTEASINKMNKGDLKTYILSNQEGVADDEAYTAEDLEDEKSKGLKAIALEIFNQEE